MTEDVWPELWKLTARAFQSRSFVSDETSSLWNSVKDRLERQVDEAKYVDRNRMDGLTYLHLLFSSCSFRSVDPEMCFEEHSFKVPVDLVHLVIDILPQLVKMKTEDGKFPIHFAVRPEVFCPQSLIKRLIEVYPKALECDHNYPGPPLHDAFRSTFYVYWSSRHPWPPPEDDTLPIQERVGSLHLTDRSLDVIGMLIDVYPKAVMFPTKFTSYDDLMMFISSLWKLNAIINQKSNGTIRSNLCLLTNIVLRARFHEKFGPISFHPIQAMLCESCRPLEIRSLRIYWFDRYKNWLSRIDFSNTLPLSLSIKNGYPFEPVVSAIYSSYPKAAAKRDYRSRLYPFMLAACSEVKQNQLDEIYLLCREYDGFVNF